MDDDEQARRGRSARRCSWARSSTSQDFLADLRALGTDSKFEQLARDLTDVLKRRDSVIVFTQYTDTMDYLRDKLRHVYGAQVACYSGRGGERWEGKSVGGHQQGEHQDGLPRAAGHQDPALHRVGLRGLEPPDLRRADQLRHAVEPDAGRAADRPYRPHRAGLPRRSGFATTSTTARSRPTVYQRLDDRITSFESVVGELQPILSQVAKVIEAAAMANDKRRGELIAKEVAEINRRVREEEISALNLDKFVDDTVEAATEEPSPVTLPELERAIVESAAMRGRFEPHPEIRRGAPAGLARGLRGGDLQSRRCSTSTPTRCGC